MFKLLPPCVDRLKTLSLPLFHSISKDISIDTTERQECQTETASYVTPEMSTKMWA